MCKVGIKIYISLGFAKIKGDDICESLWVKSPREKKKNKCLVWIRIIELKLPEGRNQVW